jgi:hypothetical protein
MRWTPRSVLLASIAASAPAGADNAEVHATASGAVATTDNLLSAPIGSRGRRGDVFLSVRPGGLFTYNARRMIHEVVAEVEFLEYLMSSEKPSVTFRAGWKGFFLPTPRSDFSIGANASMGQLHALNFGGGTADVVTTLVIPPGRIDVAQASGNQNLSWTASRATRLWQSGFARYASTADNNPGTMLSSEAFEAGALLGFDRRYRDSTFVVQAGGSFVHLERLDPLVIQQGSRLDRQLNPRATLAFRHDLDQRWSTNVDAGVVYVHPTGVDPHNPDDERTGGWYPVFGGVLAYTDVWGRAALDARRTVAPNLFIAQNTVSDRISVQAAMPLVMLDKEARRRQPRMVGLANLTIERTQLIEPTSDALVTTFHSARIDLGVGWSPREGQTLGVRYELAYQHANQVAMMSAASFVRNTFFFTFALRYPEDVQVRVPRRTNSVRSDRGDLSPIGAEPVVIDPAELLPGDGR